MLTKDPLFCLILRNLPVCRKDDPAAFAVQSGQPVNIFNFWSEPVSEVKDFVLSDEQGRESAS